MGRTTLAAAVLLVACARAPLPARLCGMARSKLWRGERAALLVAGLHGRDVAPVSSTVADYGRAGQVRVYLSRFNDAGKARRALDAMLARLATGDTPFLPPRELGEHPGQWLTVGPGGHHAVWVSGESLYWVTAEPGQIEEAMAELPAASTGLWT